MVTTGIIVTIVIILFMLSAYDMGFERGTEQLRKNSSSCWFCGADMDWINNFSYEDYGMDGNGIVTSLFCSECDASAEFYIPTEKKEENKDDTNNSN